MAPYLLWALVGWGLAAWVMMRIFWLPDPPPNWLTQFVALGIAGAAGGIGGGLVAGASNSTPGIELAAVVAGSFVFVSAARGFMGKSPARP